MSAAAWFWESLTRPFVSPDRTLPGHFRFQW